ncbi:MULTISPECIES: hypothetical protein [Anaeromyxobacter]|uniref:hypothetical protein n=1 Tax=Anaeromyxobacter TaxID=161492 RepID=UPI001F5949FB|nr:MULTISPECIES: hypothetical protein [unclassified Anaeromyxobacter]
MTSASMFSIEVLTALLCSVGITAVLTRPLRAVLTDVCGTPERAGFWVRYANVMLFLAPLVGIVVFGRSGSLAEPTLGFYKAALGSALSGAFVALAAIGLQVSRFLPRRNDGAPPAG